MGEKDNYLWVGLFVLGSLLAGIALLLQLGRVSGEADQRDYVLLFERDVSGLSVGAAVTYLGVGVGEVRDIRLRNGEHVSVEVSIDITGSTPISQATYASLAYQGVTGVAVINLAEDPSLPTTPLEPAGNDEMLLPTRDAGIAALLAEGPELGNRLSELLGRANTLLADNNLARIEQSLASLASVSTSLAEQQAAIAALPVDLREVVAQAGRLVDRIDGLTVSLAPELQKTTSSLASGTQQLSEITLFLQDWLQRHEVTLNQAMDDGVSEIPALIHDARGTLASLNELVERLERNPSRLIYRASSDDLVLQP